MLPPTLLAALLLGLLALPAAGQLSDEPPPALEAARTVLRFFTDDTPDHANFVAQHLSSSLRVQEGDDALVNALEVLRTTLGGRLPDEVLEGEPGEMVIGFPQKGDALAVRLHVRIDLAAPEQIADVWIEGGQGLDSSEDHAPPKPLGPITWDNLEARLREESESWYSGAVLVLRDGEVVLREGFGLADRENGVPNKADTIFAVGSTPIDFTKVAVLLLIERGELSWDAPLSRFFEQVPEDKSGITVEQLMTGASGFADFFDVPEDGNPDHTFITRDELVRRMFASELLFTPGEGREHSHGAFGLLAAVVEIVSGQTYQAYTRTHIFEPAGMADTAFFGEPLPEGRYAVGYGLLTNGEVNAPPYWGETSWLVMGSGGMVSTLDDLLAFQQALRAREILSADSLARYWSPPGAVSSNGDGFGFELLFTEDPGQQVFLVSNSTTPRTQHRLEELMAAILRLVRGG